MSAFKQLFTSPPKSYRDNDWNGHHFDRARLSQEQETLLASLLGEFYNSARLTVVSASIVNARAFGTKLQNIGRPSAVMPADPLIFPAVATGLAPSLGHPGLVRALHDYYMRLAFARTVSAASAHALDSETQPGNRKIAQLADVWRRLCGLASLVTYHAYDVERIEDPVRKGQLASIQQLIKAAQNGESPCVRGDGTLFVPGWLEERREERKAAGWTIMIHSSTGREAATLSDISTGGMGLAFCRIRPIGSQITVELQDGRCLAGVVAWAHNDRMGARFLQPLSHNDPIMTAVCVNNFPPATLN